ncbi:MAG: GNAT family N-acetyltransferase [Phycisphaerales bacterium]|nr:GNAT family N-acetyltransferase [Phycisphaerales bacterium]
MTPLIRPVRATDIPDIVVLLSRIYAAYGGVMDLAGIDAGTLRVDRWPREKGGELWIAEFDGSARATCGVTMDGDVAWLKTVYVDARLRRQGLATRLVGEATRFAITSGARTMKLWSDTRFVEAHRLYRRLGFQEFGERDLHDLNNTREFGFEIELSSMTAQSGESRDRHA